MKGREVHMDYIQKAKHSSHWPDKVLPTMHNLLS